jgi:tetratricopeptide (TPR) repeat protein
MKSFIRIPIFAFALLCLTFLPGYLLAQDGTAGAQNPGGTQELGPNEVRSQQEKVVADQLFTALDELVPGDFVEESELKRILQLASTEFAAGDLVEAFNQLQRANEIDKQSPPARLMMAALYFATGKFVEAKAVLEVAAVERSEYPGIFLAFARMAINEGRIADAQAHYEKAQRLMTEKTWEDKQLHRFKLDLKDGMVDVAIQQQRFDDAIVYLNELGEMVPENSKVPFRLAEIAFSKGKQAEAIEFLKKAKELEPNSQAVELTIARWYARKNLKPETEHWIEKAVEAHPQDPTVMTEYAKWHFQNMDMDKAMAAIAKARENGADKDMILFLEGQFEFARGNYDAAAKALEQLQQQRPGIFEYTHMLALTLIESKDEEKRAKALDLVRINLQMNQKNQLAFAAYGWVQFRLGNLQQAQQAFQQAGSTNQLNAETAYFMASYLAKVGQTQQALQLVDGALSSSAFILYRGQAEKLKQQLEAELKNQQEKAAEGESSDKSGDGK